MISILSFNVTCTQTLVFLSPYVKALTIRLLKARFNSVQSKSKLILSILLLNSTIFDSYSG